MSDKQITIEQIREMVRKGFAGYNSKSKEQQDKEFIEAFGQELFDELELIHKYDDISFKIAYDLSIEPLLICFEDIEEDARFYPGDELTGPYIVINRKHKNNEIEVVKSIAHESRHYYQMMIINDDIVHPLKNIWKEDLDKYNSFKPVTDDDYAKYMCISYEFDAFAYTKYIINKLYNINLTIGGEEYSATLVKYISKYIDNWLIEMIL